MKFISSFVCLTILVSIQFSDAMPGGWNNISVEEVKQYIPKIESFYNSETNDPNYAVVAKLISAKSQVVAGIKYAIKFRLSKTDCEKVQVTNGLKSPMDCKPLDSVDCVANVYVRAWENYEEVTQVICDGF